MNKDHEQGKETIRDIGKVVTHKIRKGFVRLAISKSSLMQEHVSHSPPAQFE